MTGAFTFKCDGRTCDVDPAERDTPLLYVLRNTLGFDNPRFGCGLAQCGACTVLVDGAPARSCVVAAGAVAGRQVTTLAGLGTRQEPHRLQAAFIDAQATQCGYCLNGWIMTAAALLDRKPQPTLTEIAEALAGLKCRCGAHMSIMRAIVRAAGASET